MTDHVGEWHTLVISEEEGERDYEISHPASCPKNPDVEFISEYACDLDNEIGYAGFVGFDPPAEELKPGAYRIRFWSRSSYSYYYGSTEWDTGVEVEALSTAGTEP